MISIAARSDSAVRRSLDTRQIRMGYKQTHIQHKLPNAATNKTPQTNKTQTKFTHIQHKLPNATNHRRLSLHIDKRAVIYLECPIMPEVLG